MLFQDQFGQRQTALQGGDRRRNVKVGPARQILGADDGQRVLVDIAEGHHARQ